MTEEPKLTAVQWEELAKNNKLRSGRKQWKDYGPLTRFFAILGMPVLMLVLMFWFGSCIALCMKVGGN